MSENNQITGSAETTMGEVLASMGVDTSKKKMSQSQEIAAFTRVRKVKGIYTGSAEDMSIFLKLRPEIAEKDVKIL